ncbi:MAG: hypothetical protein ACREOB_01920 [Thermodesulfobacteriota bacterium]
MTLEEAVEELINAMIERSKELADKILKDEKISETSTLALEAGINTGIAGALSILSEKGLLKL